MRKRWKRARELCTIANEILYDLNSIDSGLRAHRTHRRVHCTASDARSALLRRIMELAAKVASVRRDPSIAKVSGAQATASLARAELTDHYSFRASSHNQVQLKAAALDEPQLGWPSVNLLDALPPDEARFYADEANCLELAGKSKVLFDQLQEQYGFVSGDYSEYLA